MQCLGLYVRLLFEDAEILLLFIDSFIDKNNLRATF